MNDRMQRGIAAISILCACVAFTIAFDYHSSVMLGLGFCFAGWGLLAFPRNSDPPSDDDDESDVDEFDPEADYYLRPRWHRIDPKKKDDAIKCISIESLRPIWDTPEEDEAWAYLQEGQQNARTQAG